MESEKTIVKKKKTIILSMLMLTLVIAIGILVFILNSLIQKSKEPQNGNVNTLYIDEQILR